MDKANADQLEGNNKYKDFSQDLLEGFEKYIGKICSNSLKLFEFVCYSSRSTT